MSVPTVVANELNFPTSLVFDSDGRIYVAESGLAFGDSPPGGRVWRLENGSGDAARTLIADDFAAPVTGLCWHDGRLYVSEGGAGRISRIERDGQRKVIVHGMPGPGNYHTNMAVVGADQKLYFSQGAMTNLGVIGLDAYELGWLRRLPHAHDVPGLNIALTGANFATPDPRTDDPHQSVQTGGFVPFGTKTTPGQRVAAALPCTAAVMRCDLDGGGLELVAWGLRNAFGLGFLPDGRLLAVDQGSDDRGSRPIGNTPDLLFDVIEGRLVRLAGLRRWRAGDLAGVRPRARPPADLLAGQPRRAATTATATGSVRAACCGDQVRRGSATYDQFRRATGDGVVR